MVANQRVLAESDHAEILKRVAASWASQQSSVASAKVKFLWTHLTIDETQHTVEEVEELLQTFKFTADEDCVRRLIQLFQPSVLERHRRHDQSTGPWNLWWDYTLLDDGQRTRISSSTNEHLLANGLHLVASRHLAGQVSAFERGQSRYSFPDLQFLLSTPPIGLLDEIETVDSAGDTVRLITKYGEAIVLDQELNLPVIQKAINKETGFGRIKFFRDPVLFPGDVTIPMYQLEVGFREGVARSIEFSAVVDAEFNLNLPDREFVMAADKGTVLVDKRNDEGRSLRLEQGIEDVAEFFQASGISGGVTPPPPKSSFSWKNFFLIGNGIFLILVGVILWRRGGS